MARADEAVIDALDVIRAIEPAVSNGLQLASRSKSVNAHRPRALPQPSSRSCEMSDPSTRAFTHEQVRLRERYGPWAVVTGASDGIGREFAAHLAEAGVNLVLAARRKELLDDVANGLARAHDVQVEAISVDLATPVRCRTNSSLEPVTGTWVFSSHRQALGRQVRSWMRRSMKNWG